MRGGLIMSTPFAGFGIATPERLRSASVAGAWQIAQLAAGNTRSLGARRRWCNCNDRLRLTPSAFRQ